MAEKDIDFDVLSQVTDTTFGRSSLNVVSGYSVIFSFGPGPTLLAKFNAIINFGNEGDMVLTKKRYQDDASSVIKLYVDRVKSDYKSITGDTLTLRDAGFEDSLQILSSNPYNARHTALFRRIMTLEMS